jgi:hypothetical protein
MSKDKHKVKILWKIILLSGAFGGIINAIISDNGFIRPREETVDSVTIIRPGLAGNILLGAVAAFISWGLKRGGQNAASHCSRYRCGLKVVLR